MKGFYKKKPVIIEAVQWDGDNEFEVAEFMKDMPDSEFSYKEPDNPCVLIKTLEGTMTASKGDWIIRGVHGEYYPCKPDIFGQTYELV